MRIPKSVTLSMALILVVAFAFACHGGTAAYRVEKVDSPQLREHRFEPLGIAVDAAGAVFIADPPTCAVWKLADGTLSIVAAAPGCADRGQPPAPLALNGWPVSLAVDNDGAVFVGLGGSGGVGGGIVKIEGGSVVPVAPCLCSPEIDAAAQKTHEWPPQLEFPVSLAVAPNGDIFAGDHCRVLQVRDGTVTSIAGGSKCAELHSDPPRHTSPSADVALGELPSIALQTDGTLLEADTDTCRIWKTEDSGLVAVAGTGALKQLECVSGGDGTAPLDTSIHPASIAVDGRGTVYLSDRECRVRVIANGRVTTAADGICGLLAAAPTSGVYVWDVEQNQLYTVTPSR